MRKQADKLIQSLAFYDALTKLPNRLLLNDRLEQTIAASKRSGQYGSLMFIDLDNFKSLNDEHGHSVGDLLLIEVSRRINVCLREIDTVARLGGDEFVVVLSELGENKTDSTVQARRIAQKINICLAEPYLLTPMQEGNKSTTVAHHCTASIGVVMFSGETNMKKILHLADMAMYQAKEDGRNTSHFYTPNA